MKNKQSHFSALIERSAMKRDEQWLWEQYSILLKPSIDMQWGWDEEFQLSSFRDHLPYHLFTIVEKENYPVATYATKNNSKCIYLHMLLVVSEYQLCGIGSHVMKSMQAQATENGLPIELSISPSNNVTGFYEKHGFKLIEVTTDKKLFRWLPEDLFR